MIEMQEPRYMHRMAARADDPNAKMLHAIDMLRVELIKQTMLLTHLKRDLRLVIALLILVLIRSIILSALR